MIEVETSKIKRYDNIDLLKALAMFCVIIIHGYGMEFDFWNNGNLANYRNYFFRTFLSTSVPLFFTCNGFLLFNRNLNFKKHIIKTVHYILLSYIWGIITTILWSIINKVPVSVREIILSIQDWRFGVINHLWFMGALVSIYVIFPILKYASEREKYILVYFFLGSLIFLIQNNGFNIFIKHPSECLQDSFRIFDPFRGLYDWTYVYFSLGGIMALYLHEINNFLKKYSKFITIVAGMTLIISNIMLFLQGIYLSKTINGHWDVVWNGYNTIFTLISVISIFILSLNYTPWKYNLFNILTRKISANTLGIYFIHMTIIHLMEKSSALSSWSQKWDTLATKSLLVLLISLFVTKLIKKIPYVKNLVQ